MIPDNLLLREEKTFSLSIFSIPWVILYILVKFSIIRSRNTTTFFSWGMSVSTNIILHFLQLYNIPFRMRCICTKAIHNITGMAMSYICTMTF